MKYLKIQSKNEIEVEALSLMGASTKRDDPNSIGEWGSGGKYSISTMLRNQVNFKIFSGLNPIEIATKKVTLRDKSFEKIVIEGKETSLTTDMGGKDWDNSFSYIREIYSNALDEDTDTSLEISNNLEGKEGYTTYYIELNKDVKDFYENVDKYFCGRSKNILYSNGNFSIIAGDGNLRLFRKGILCKESDKERSIYHYNSHKFVINESRILSDTWEARYQVGIGWKKCTNKDLIFEFLMRINGTNTGLFEHSIIWGSSSSFDSAWGEALKDKKLVGLEHVDMFNNKDIKDAIQLPFDFLKLLKRQFSFLNIMGLSEKSESVSLKVEPPKRLENKVLDSISELLKTDYKERLKNPVIEYRKFSNSNILGQASDNKILLSVKLDNYSVAEISKIIIEENEHNITGYEDESRTFQNHLFNLYYDQLKYGKA